MLREPLAVSVLIAVNLIAFAYELSLSSGVRESVVGGGALVPYNVTHGVQLPPPAPPGFATIVTAQFLHASLPHVAFNMLFLAAFGPAVEALVGHTRFACFYLACGALGNVAQLSASAGSHVPSLGASGAVAGVLGAYVVRFPTRPVVHVPAVLLIGLWAASQFVHGFAALSPNALPEAGGGIAYVAHMGGFLAGVLTIGLFEARSAAR